MLRHFLKVAASVMVVAMLVLCSGNAFAQNRALSGKVVDGTGAPVVGAAVMVAGNSSNGTVTDMEGQFKMTVPSNATLIVSCLGFADKQVQVGNQSVITITLEEDVTYLDETVVIGYGVQKKSDLTGAVRLPMRPPPSRERWPVSRSSPTPAHLEAALESRSVVFRPTAATSDRSSLWTASRSAASSISTLL